jgi:hypothetical protein
MSQSRWLYLHDACHECNPFYFLTAPQAMRSPELPEGSVFMSSALAWITIAVPPLLKRECGPSDNVTSSLRMVTEALPEGLTVKFCISPA